MAGNLTRPSHTTDLTLTIFQTVAMARDRLRALDTSAYTQVMAETRSLMRNQRQSASHQAISHTRSHLEALRLMRSGTMKAAAHYARKRGCIPLVLVVPDILTAVYPDGIAFATNVLRH